MKPAVLGRAFGASLMLVLRGMVILPTSLRFLVVLGVGIAWASAACRWAVRKYGRRAFLPFVAVPIIAIGLAGREYWRDLPNRRLLGRIEELPGFYPANGHKLVVGRVEHVYIARDATDADVARFTDLELKDLRVVLVRAPISDATARRFGRLKSLFLLTFQGVRVEDDTIAELEQELPGCIVKVVDD